MDASVLQAAAAVAAADKLPMRKGGAYANDQDSKAQVTDWHRLSDRM